MIDFHEENPRVFGCGEKMGRDFPNGYREC